MYSNLWIRVLASGVLGALLFGMFFASPVSHFISHFIRYFLPFYFIVSHSIIIALMVALFLIGVFPWRKWLPWAIGVALIGLLLFYLFGYQITGDWQLKNFYAALAFKLDSDIVLSRSFLIFRVALILPFVANAIQNGKVLDYGTLIFATWSLALSGLAYIVFGTLGLMFTIFMSFVIDAFVIDGFLKPVLSYPVEGMLILSFGFFGGLGVAISKLQPNFMAALRKLLSGFALILYPILWLLVMIIAIRMPLLAIQSQNLSEEISQTGILIALIVSSIIAISVIMDARRTLFTSERSKLYSALTISAQILAVAISVLGLFAIWGVGVRIQDYGVTPYRYWLALFAFEALIFSIGYAIVTLWKRKTWAQSLEAFNILAVLLLVALLALTALPFLGPYNLASKSQLARYESGTPIAELPIEKMSRQWGEPGRRALITIARESDDPNAKRLLNSDLE